MKQNGKIERAQLDKITSKLAIAWKKEQKYEKETTQYRKRNVSFVGKKIMKDNPHILLPFMMVTPERCCRKSAYQNTMQHFTTNDGKPAYDYSFSDEGREILREWAEKHNLQTSHGYLELLRALTPKPIQEDGKARLGTNSGSRRKADRLFKQYRPIPSRHRMQEGLASLRIPCPVSHKTGSSASLQSNVDQSAHQDQELISTHC